MGKSLTSMIQAANTILITNGDLDAVGNFFMQDYVVHLTGRDIKGGHDTVQDIVSSLRHSFPDIQVEVDILLESDTRVAWQRTLRGTHESKFKGFPASGLQVVWRDMLISQFRDGLIAEEWVVTDLAEQLLLSRKRSPKNQKVK
jgi:steroid delta-isomerase-like uncharacterized protein